MTRPTPTDEQVRSKWSSGSYPDVGRSFMSMAAQLVDAADVETGSEVLDIACGTGNVALTANRRGAQVTGLDITPAMLDTARERADAIDADVEWREGDAGSLPFDDDEFDVTLSCLGHMLVPEPASASAELVRVTRPGGRIGFISWTRDSAIPSMKRALSEYLPPKPDSPPGFLWGDPDTVRERLGDAVEDLRFDRAAATYPALSPEHFWELHSKNAGPMVTALEHVDEDDRPAAREAVVDALEEYFSDTDNAMELEYRLVTATVR